MTNFFVPPRLPSRSELVKVAETALEKALMVQRPIARAHVDRIRRSHPDATPATLVRALERHYLAGVTTMGAASGAAAAVPGVGQTAGLVLVLGEVPVFLDATVLFTLALAEIHGLDVHDIERRRTLVLAVVLGDAGVGFIEKIAGRTGPHMARRIIKAVPMKSIRAVNKVMGKNFVTKYGTKQGILVLGRVVPFGIGAAIGAAGNAAIGSASVGASRKVFGPPPAAWPAPQ